MLPKHHYDESDSQTFNDSNWIAEQVDLLPISMQKEIVKRYSDIYLKLTVEEDSKARFRTNTWLRRTVDKNKVINKDGYF